MTVTDVLPRPEVTPAGPWFFPKAERFTVANGLTVVSYHLPGKLVASMRLLLDLPVGAEPAGLEGIGSVAMNSLDEGTTSYDGAGFAGARNRLGASYGASVDANAGMLLFDVPVSRLAPALELLAEASTRPTFPAAEVERLIKQRLDAITNELASPAQRAAVEMSKAYYKAGTRRSLSNGGTTETVTALTREAVESYYLSRISPSSSTLIVAGDLSSVDLPALVQASFGDWVVGSAVVSTEQADDIVAGPQVVVIDRPGSVQTQLLVAVPGVSRGHEDFGALQVAAFALGGGMDSRLMKVLREEKGYTYGVGCQIAPERSDGRLIMGGAFQTEVTADAVAELLTIVRGFATAGLLESERVAAVEQLAGRAPLSFERPQAVAAQAAINVTNGLPDDYTDAFRSALRTTTTDSVNAAFARSIDLSRMVIVAVGDGSKITEGLQGTGLGDVTVVPA